MNLKKYVVDIKIIQNFHLYPAAVGGRQHTVISRQAVKEMPSPSLVVLICFIALLEKLEISHHKQGIAKFETYHFRGGLSMPIKTLINYTISSLTNLKIMI